MSWQPNAHDLGSRFTQIIKRNLGVSGNESLEFDLISKIILRGATNSPEILFV